MADRLGGMTRTERYTFYALLLITFFGIVLWVLTVSRIQALETEVENNQASIAEARALDCRIILGLGLKSTPKGPCYDPEVLRHYDPEEAAPTAEEQAREQESDEAFLRIFCKILDANDLNDHACARYMP